MSHGCFISYKKEDKKYKDKIVRKLTSLNCNVSSLDEWIESSNTNTILNQIRSKYMSNTTVTIFLIGLFSKESKNHDFKGHNEQFFIIKELQATLYDRDGNPRDGLLGVVLPTVENIVFPPKAGISQEGNIKNKIVIDDTTVIREFSRNFWMGPNPNYDLRDSDRYAVLCRYCEFMNNPNFYIDKAFEKSRSEASKKVTIRGIKHKGMMPLRG